MLLEVVSSLIVIYSRELKLNGIMPDTILQVRVLVLISFSLQIILILLGNRRKYIAHRWLQIGLWVAYQAARWVATYTLSILSKDSKNPSMDPDFIIWAPFFLLHLAGPDTITAYSPEDNELWLRHLFGLISQLFVAFPVIQISWNHGKVFYVIIPVMVAGIIKYCERTWSLWLASSKELKESILPPPDPGPNYAHFSSDLSEKIAEGYKVRLRVESTPISFNHFQIAIANESIQDAYFLQHGFNLFTIFEFLFADLVVTIQDHDNSQYFFQNITSNDAFKVIEIELGWMYDKLYTKAAATYSPLGISLKLLSFFCTLSAFLLLMMDNKGHRDYDKIITLVLFIGAILFDIYAFIVLLSSSWTMLWLSSHRSRIVDISYWLISRLQTILNLSHTKRWSNLVSQFNLIDFCLKKDQPLKCIIKIKQLRRIYLFLKKAYYHKAYHQPRHPVSEELKELIYKKLREKSWSAKNTKACKTLCAYRGDRVLHRWKCHSIDWSTKVEFDQSLLLWHIATDLCYHSDVNAESSPAVEKNYEISRLLSNYMLNLLVKRPSMLPNGIGQIRFEDTCAVIRKILQDVEDISQRDQLCEWILEVDTRVEPSAINGEVSKSVVFDASRLAKSLKSLEMEKNWTKERKSEIIRDVWVEILCHAASQCRGLHHAKRLSRGGELLTHVWLLMAHLGITEQFQVSQGFHTRARVMNY